MSPTSKGLGAYRRPAPAPMHVSFLLDLEGNPVKGEWRLGYGRYALKAGVRYTLLRHKHQAANALLRVIVETPEGEIGVDVLAGDIVLS